MERVEFWTREVDKNLPPEIRAATENLLRNIGLTEIATVTENAAAEFERQLKASQWQSDGRDPADTPEEAAKPVQVLAVEEAVYHPMVVAGEALPLENLQAFSSAQELSRHMGYTSNQAAQALWRAKREGKEEATLRGVSFRYVAAHT